MAGRPRTVPGWFGYADLVCAAVAGVTWYALPQAGPWPLALALAPWLVRLGVTRRIPRCTSFGLPLGLFLLTAGVSVWAAYDRQVAWSKLWLIVGGVLFFYALVHAEALGGKRAWLLAFLGGGVSLYFLATHDWGASSAKIEALTRPGRALQAGLPVLAGHRLDPDVAGGILAMMLPFAGWAVAEAWQTVRLDAPPRSTNRWLALCTGLGLLALITFGLVMTTSHGAWVGLASALMLAGLWSVVSRFSRGRVGRRVWVFAGVAALGLVAIVGVGLAWPGGPVAALSAMAGLNTGSYRMTLLRNTLTLVRDYPFVGAGLGGYQMLYSTYVFLLHVGYSIHSDNLFLDVAVEQGLLALLALAWMWFLFAKAVWQRGLRSCVRLEVGVLGAAALSLTVVLVHGLVDDALYGSRGVLLLFVPLAFAVPRAGERARNAGRPWAMGLSLVLVLLLGLTLVWRAPLYSLVYSNLGAVHQSQAELSIYTWPEWPIQDAVRRAVDLSRPVAEFERALALDPGNATANRRLGMIDLSLARYEDALRHLEAAYASEPGNPATRQLLGEALIANGRLDEGSKLWAEVPNEQSQLAARVFWYQYIGDAERAAWMQEAADSK
jgi:hypothetical protein